jgi:hypothetical protein
MFPTHPTMLTFLYCSTSNTTLAAIAPVARSTSAIVFAEQEGNVDRGAMRLGAAGYERAQRSRTQAEATRNELHGETDERQQRRGRKYKNGETGDDKCRRRDCAEESERGLAAVKIAVHAAVVMTAARTMRAVQSGTRRLAEVRMS